MFIQSEYIANSILSDSEKSAIVNEAYAEHPAAAHIEIVEGGIMVFDSYEDYETWTQQD